MLVRLDYSQSDVVEREATAEAALFDVALSQVKRLRVARGEVVMATRMAGDVRACGDGEREGGGADECRETHSCEEAWGGCSRWGGGQVRTVRKAADEFWTAD